SQVRDPVEEPIDPLEAEVGHPDLVAVREAQRHPVGAETVRLLGVPLQGGELTVLRRRLHGRTFDYNVLKNGGLFTKGSGFRRCASGVLLAVLLAITAGAGSSLLGICGPFTDVAADAFCPFVLEIFYLGITTGTTATTYDPASPVSRLQMAAFLSRTVDAALKRGSRRAALDQFWTSMNATVLGFTTVGGFPQYPASDGTDIWV